MLRRSGASVAVLALLYGLSGAPYTHAHHAIESVSDEHHPHGQALVHTHATPHSHGDEHGAPPARELPDDERIWSVDSFVFQQPTVSQIPIPVLFVIAERDVELPCVWLGARRLQPKAHGPPFTLSSPLRAPPVFIPKFA
jgi:hypothetical protein